MIESLEKRVLVPVDLASRLAEAWKPVFSRIGGLAAAWLFGSAARGSPAADLDVGILLKDRPFLGLAEKAALAAQLEDVSPVPLPVDIRALTDEEPIFSFRVLKEGVRIFDGARDVRVPFEATVFSRYQDIAPGAEICRQGLFRRLRNEQG